VVGVLAQAAQGGDVELQARGGDDFQAQPRHCHGTQDVTVGKRKHPTINDLAQPDELEGTRIDLGGRLSARRSVSVNLPAWMLVVNLRRGDAFVLAVIRLA